MNLRGLLARLGTWSRPRGPRNLWRALGDAFRAQDERAGRTRGPDGEEDLRCGWSHLHPQGGDEDEPGRGRRER